MSILLWGICETLKKPGKVQQVRLSMG